MKRATTIPLTLVSLLLTGLLSPSLAQPAQSTPQPAQATPAQPVPAQSAAKGGRACAQIAAACKTGGLCCTRRQDGRRHSIGLHPTDHAGYAATEASYQTFAANRSAACGGLQGAESEVRNSPWDEITTERIANNQTVDVAVVAVVVELTPR